MEDQFQRHSLQMLRQAGITHVLGNVLAVLAAVALSGGLGMFLAGMQETALAFLMAGGVLAALSAVAFVFAASTRRLLVATIDTTRTDWKLRESIRLAEAMADPDIRTRLLTALTFHLSGAVPTPGVVREVMAPRERTAEPGERPAPTYYEWRAHFRRRCGRRGGRRLVLERDP